jgi:hypothetical protein
MTMMARQTTPSTGRSMHKALLAVVLALPLPAAAQSFAAACRVEVNCVGDICVETDVTLMFETIPGGLRSWDAASPAEPMEMIALPGQGAVAWVGRTALGDVALLTQLSDTEAVMSLHTDREADPAATAYLICE